MNKLKMLWSQKAMRTRILYTIMILLIYRIGCNLPVPFFNQNGFSSKHERNYIPDMVCRIGLPIVFILVAVLGLILN